MKYYIITTFNTIAYTPIWTKSAVLFLAVMAPYASMIHILIAFWAVDLATGIMHSTKKKFIEEKPKGFFKKLKIFWKNFESRKLRWSVEKIACYLLVVVLMAFLEQYFFPFSLAGYTLTKIACAFFALIELKSIFENLSLLTKSQIFIKIFGYISKEFKNKTGVDV